MGYIVLSPRIKCLHEAGCRDYCQANSALCALGSNGLPSSYTCEGCLASEQTAFSLVHLMRKSLFTWFSFLVSMVIPTRLLPLSAELVLVQDQDAAECALLRDSKRKGTKEFRFCRVHIVFALSCSLFHLLLYINLKL